MSMETLINSIKPYIIFKTLPNDLVGLSTYILSDDMAPLRTTGLLAAYIR
jgi:hypothetical protein